MYEPIHQDVRVLSKKIPVTKFLSLQVGIGHNFQSHATGWNWKLTTCLGGDGISRIQNKTSLGLFPGMDLRFGWRADYVLPEITGALGTVVEKNFILNRRWQEKDAQHAWDLKDPDH
ncbi:OBP3-RESPONSIVE PROTEIN 4 (ORG4) [Salix viminalis]|uniref:OBP3-RESPONSIVE PROTEIN 4 (ORG4) n=1 Tax=Salix viminalis TaxID=40686 RepID=A0A9Q0ZQA6_SALVM|nr:OBP3-RESPONSIVE PROTEIN 4 (ORG4) [Salix viminalis]